MGSTHVGQNAQYTWVTSKSAFFGNKIYKGPIAYPRIAYHLTRFVDQYSQNILY